MIYSLFLICINHDVNIFVYHWHISMMMLYDLGNGSLWTCDDYLSSYTPIPLFISNKLYRVYRVLCTLNETKETVSFLFLLHNPQYNILQDINQMSICVCILELRLLVLAYHYCENRTKSRHMPSHLYRNSVIMIRRSLDLLTGKDGHWNLAHIELFQI